MKYRKLGKPGVDVSVFGFGAMRLPTIKEENDRIDEEHAAAMMAYAFDNGVNYVDTAYGYHNNESERVVGNVLKNGYRDKVYVATKLPTWMVKTQDDFDRLLGEQLEKLQTDHIDFYLLHNLNSSVWPRMLELGILDRAEAAKTDGRIGRLGFSFHDTFDVFRQILEGYDWPFCQLQYNYMNEDVQAGTEGVRLAAAHGVDVIVMEPLYGGSLVRLPEAVQALWARHGCTRTPADVALRWLWDKPEVSLVLSGVSNLEQTKQNVACACESGVGTLSDGERALVAAVQETLHGLRPIPCTTCGYCMPCPQGVDIPVNLRLYNDAHTYGGNTEALNRAIYGGMTKTRRAAACTACGACEEKCPQKIAVSTWMKTIDKTFA